MNYQNNYTWKIVIAGAGGAGKTTFIQRFINGTFIPDTKLTVGVSFNGYVIQRIGKTFNLLLWDLGGQDRFRFVQGQYIKGAAAAIVFFDMNRLETLSQVKDWVDMIRKHAQPGIPIILGGAKIDLVNPELQAGIHDAAEQIVEQLGLDCYIASSSKSGVNTRETMDYLVDLLYWHAHSNEPRPEHVADNLGRIGFEEMPLVKELDIWRNVPAPVEAASKDDLPFGKPVLDEKKLKEKHDWLDPFKKK